MSYQISYNSNNPPRTSEKRTTNQNNNQKSNRIDLTSSQEHEIMQIFDVFDTDQTGLIDKKDMLRALSIVCPDIYGKSTSKFFQEKDLARICKKFEYPIDLAAEEVLFNRYQFVTILKAKIVYERSDQNQNDLINFFNKLDSGKKGYVTEAELRRNCNIYCEDVAEATIVSVIEETCRSSGYSDEDGGGRVYLKDFLGMMKRAQHL